MRPILARGVGMGSRNKSRQRIDGGPLRSLREPANRNVGLREEYGATCSRIVECLSQRIGKRCAVDDALYGKCAIENILIAGRTLRDTRDKNCSWCGGIYSVIL